MKRSRKDTAAEKGYVPEVARKKKRVMRAVVPRIVFSTLFVGVVPACVSAACGGSVQSSSTNADGGTGGFGVADVAFRGGDVAAQCFAGSTDPACQQFTVAAACFDGSTNPGCPPDNPDAADAADDADNDAADGAG